MKSVNRIIKEKSQIKGSLFLIDLAAAINRVIDEHVGGQGGEYLITPATLEGELKPLREALNAENPKYIDVLSVIYEDIKIEERERLQALALAAIDNEEIYA